MVSITGRRLMGGLIFIAAIALLLIAALTTGVWYFQEKITFQPQAPPFPDESGAEKVHYKTTDGLELFAYIVGSPDSTTPLLIAFHGNADLAIRQVEWAHEIVRRTGVPVMIAEYRGYMGLPGRPTYEGSRYDSEAAFRYALDHFGVDPSRIALFGHSLGTAIATELAVRHRPAALLLQSPFTSAHDMASIIAGRWATSMAWRFIARVHYDTVAALQSLDIPVSVTHGGRDHVIPTRMGKAVYDAARIKGEWLYVPDAAHGDLPLRAGDRYWSWIAGALQPLVH